MSERGGGVLRGGCCPFSLFAENGFGKSKDVVIIYGEMLFVYL